MAIFLATYQLNKQKDYQALWDEFGRLGAHKAMRDTYLLDVNLSTSRQLRDHLRMLIDSDDMLFVAKLDSKPRPWRCYEGTNAWLDARF